MNAPRFYTTMAAISVAIMLGLMLIQRPLMGFAVTAEVVAVYVGTGLIVGLFFAWAARRGA